MAVGIRDGWIMRVISAALALGCALLPATAHAEAEADPPAEDDAPRPTLELGGKVFARAQADQRNAYARDLSIPTARFQVKAGYGAMRAVLEADIASKSLIKDAYIRLADDDLGLRLYAGQFKAPFLERTLESRWDLPLISRGLVDDYLVNRNQLGGRRIGAMGEWKHKSWAGLEVQLGGFEGAKDALGQRLGEDLSARATFEPWRHRVQLGVDGYWADALHSTGRFAGGADATLFWHGARLTLEGLAGRLALGPFTAQILTASWLWPLGEKGRFAVEPVLGGEGLQLQGPQAGSGEAAVVGFNVHYLERVKLMVQGERGLYPGDERLQNRFAVQLAAKF